MKKFTPDILYGIVIIGASLLFLFTRLNYDVPFYMLPILFSAIYAIKYPEISFALFLNAGAYKADPRLSSLPKFLDLTIMLGVLTLIGVLYKTVSKQIKFIFPPKRVVLPYLVIVFLGLTSLIYTPGPNYGTDKLLRLSTITSLSLFLPFPIFQNNKNLKLFFSVFIILACLMILDSMWSGVEPVEFGFKEAFGSDYLAMGVIIGSALIILLFYFVLNTYSKLLKILYLCMIPFMLWGILTTGGRGPIVALIMSIVSIFIFLGFLYGKNIVSFSPYKEVYEKKTDIKVFFLIFILIMVAMIIVTNFPEYFHTTFVRFDDLKEDDTAGGRIERFQKALEAMLSFPEFFTGLGVGGFGVSFNGIDTKRGDYPHNIFLEVGSELGIAGFIAITFLMFGSLFSIMTSIKKSDSTNKVLNITLFLLLVYMGINASKSGDINDNRLLFTWIALIYACRNKEITRKIF